MKKLSEKQFEAKLVKAEQATSKTVSINLGGNLFAVFNKPTNTIAFTCRIRTTNSDTRKVIGYYPNISLASARMKANDALQKIKISSKDDEDKSNIPTFKEAFYEEWFPKKVLQYKKG